jgi:hypothetical protein
LVNVQDNDQADEVLLVVAVVAASRPSKKEK